PPSSTAGSAAGDGSASSRPFAPHNGPASPGFGGVQVATGLISLPTHHTREKVRDLGNGYVALDSMGAVCPFPLIDAKDVMADLAAGQHLMIDFDCKIGRAHV